MVGGRPPAQAAWTAATTSRLDVGAGIGSILNTMAHLVP
jgi:2-polyprenyl-3-methyl-5-hydroxy-6-metoxy-1,4-benzoquinol methylase